MSACPISQASLLTHKDKRLDSILIPKPLLRLQQGVRGLGADLLGGLHTGDTGNVAQKRDFADDYQGHYPGHK